MTVVKVPLVLWAQQSSTTAKENNFIYLTIDLPGIIHSSLKYSVTNTSISLNVDAKKSYRMCKYGLELEFYAEVDSNAMKIELTTTRSVTFIIFKQNAVPCHWPQLSKALQARIKPDVGRWSWSEGDQMDFADENILTSVTRLNFLASALIKCFQRTGKWENMEWAVLISKAAAGFGAYENVDHWTWFDKLGEVALVRFRQTGDLNHLNSAISYLNQAVQCTPSGHPEFSNHLRTLGKLYLTRYNRFGDPIDVESAISYLRQAEQYILANNMDPPTRPQSLETSRSNRLGDSGDLANVNIAMKHASHTANTDVPALFDDLGSSYAHRFSHTGSLSDVNLAISYHQRALRETPSGHEAIPTLLNNLGNSYLCRFERMGHLGDVDSAIYHHQKALQSTPDRHTDLGAFLNSLGNSYARRFERTEDIVDIDSAIYHHQQALKVTPLDHADRSSRLGNLGNSCLRRFQKAEVHSDVDSAIYYHKEAVKSTPRRHNDLSAQISNLGNSYLYRFKVTKDPSDIDSALSHQQQAVQCTPIGHPEYFIFLANVASSYSFRFSQSKDLADIDAAISYGQKVVQLTPTGHVNLPDYYKSLGDSYAIRFAHTKDLSDTHSAIFHYSRGAKAAGVPATCLACAKIAAPLAQIFDSCSSIQHYDVLINLLAEIAGLEQTIHRRHRSLIQYSSSMSRAVSAALEIDRADQAIEWLEQGRCLVWNQVDQLRTPVDHLRKEHPSLADRFTNTAKMLDALSTRSDSANWFLYATAKNSVVSQDQTLLHTLCASEYQQVLEEIRRIPGYEDFLRPSKVNRLLSSLPPDGLVIVFNIHTDRCDALALRNGFDSPLHVPLKEFSHQLAKALGETLQSDILNRRLTRDDVLARGAVYDPDSPMLLVLEVLWYKVVKPILDALAYTVPSDRSNRPRIWWCPSGPLSFLPLHAAGIYNSQSQQCVAVSDYVVSSYTPTARSVIEKFTKTPTLSTTTSLLLVSQPNTPGLSSIPSTRQETRELKDMMQKYGFEILSLEDANATRDKVKEELNSHTWAHFACHGVQDPEHPLESGLYLHDGRLELLEIMKQRIENPELAFLSACQTGTGDVKLSEEVVHLAAGMLAAGYRGVVGTMWNISDRHGPQFSGEFYRYLFDRKGPNGLDSTLAAYALDHATTEVRKSLGDTDASFLMWVPYVHFGY